MTCVKSAVKLQPTKIMLSNETNVSLVHYVKQNADIKYCLV